MAALYGRMWGHRGTATRTGTSEITANLETWNGAVRLVLMKNGTFRLYSGDKYSPANLVAEGKIKE